MRKLRARRWERCSRQAARSAFRAAFFAELRIFRGALMLRQRSGFGLGGGECKAFAGNASFAGGALGVLFGSDLMKSTMLIFLAR
jgi:hypothetical protein